MSEPTPDPAQGHPPRRSFIEDVPPSPQPTLRMDYVEDVPPNPDPVREEVEKIREQTRAWLAKLAAVVWVVFMLVWLVVALLGRDTTAVSAVVIPVTTVCAGVFGWYFPGKD